MEFFILLILLWISIEDFRNQEFYSFWLVFLFFGCLARYSLNHTQCSLLVLLTLVLPLLFFKEAMGGGDLWILLMLSCCMNLYEFMVMFYVATFSGLLFGMLFKQKRIAFCPFITFGVVIAFIL